MLNKQIQDDVKYDIYKFSHSNYRQEILLWQQIASNYSVERFKNIGIMWR